MREVSAIYKGLFDANGMTDRDIAKEIATLAKSPNASKLKLEALRLVLELRDEAPTGTNVNVKFPQLATPAAAAGALTAGASGSLKTPAKKLVARTARTGDAVMIDEPPDMREADVVATTRLRGRKLDVDVPIPDWPPDPNGTDARKPPNG